MNAKTIIRWVIVIIIIAGGIFLLTKKDSGTDTSGPKEFILSEQNNSKVSGTAILEETGGEVRVSINLGDDTSTRISHIHNGTCQNLGEVVFPLDNTLNGQSETLLTETLENIYSVARAINVHESAENLGSYVACGNISGGEMMEDDKDNTTMEVPAPGSEGVDEMIVEDEGVMEDGVLKEDEEEAMNAARVIVTYSNDGFSPQEITINKGESVTFINESGRGMWIASALHPTHKNYPIKSDSDCLGSSFDQCQNSEPGATWSFTFNVEGEHGFHNHIRANHFGKVIVE